MQTSFNVLFMYLTTSRTNSRTEGGRKTIMLVNGAIVHLQLALRITVFINRVLIYKLQFDMSGCCTSCE